MFCYFGHSLIFRAQVAQQVKAGLLILQSRVRAPPKVKSNPGLQAAHEAVTFSVVNGVPTCQIRPTCQIPRPHFWIYIYLYRMVL